MTGEPGVTLESLNWEWGDAYIICYARVILSLRVSRGCDLRCPVVDGVAGGALAA